MQKNKKNYRDITQVMISEDGTKVTYLDKGEAKEVTLLGLQIWMAASSFNPVAFEIAGQHVRRMLIGLYLDDLMAAHQHEQEMIELAAKVSDEQWYLNY